MDRKLVDAFNRKYEVDRKAGCWIWTASTAGKGYGQIKIPGTRRQIYAHRLSYLIHRGDIPDGMMVCHRCNTPRCVNPKHLFLETGKGNLQDMKAKDRHLRGTRNKQAKLTEPDVERIHDLHESGWSTHRIAEQFPVGQMTIWRIVNGLRWERVYKKRRGISGPA